MAPGGSCRPRRVHAYRTRSISSNNRCSLSDRELACALQVLSGEIPVGERSEHRRDEVRAPVLIIEVIGVLPDVDGEKRRQPMDERRVGIRGLHHLESALIEHEPDPATAELRGGCALELRDEGIEATEIHNDARAELAAGLAAAAGLETAPEEAVVPGLRAAIEDSCLGWVAGHFAQDILERLRGVG